MFDFPGNNSSASAYDRMTNEASDKPFPCEDELRQLGNNILNEILAAFGKDATEEQAAMIASSTIGGIHQAVLRFEREADFAADELRVLNREQDGSEVKDNQMVDATTKLRFAEAMATCLETFRDAAADTYFVETGDVWKPYRGSQRSSTSSFAIMEANEVLRMRSAKKHAAVPDFAQVVVFRAGIDCNSKIDQERIFQWLDRAKAKFPHMHLATTNNRGGEKLALAWAKNNNIPVYLEGLRAAEGKSAPFKCNDRLLSLKPVMVISMPKSLTDQDASFPGNGIMLNIADKSKKAGVPSFTLKDHISEAKVA